MFARLKCEPRAAAWLAAALLSLVWFVVYLTTVSPSVNFIDSGELITALYEPGIAHPPGYPLYILLGYVASHIPVGEIAWRVNAMSAFFGALAVGAWCVLIFRLGLFIQPRATRPAQRDSRGRRGRATGPSVPVSAAQPAGRQLAVEWVSLGGAVAGAALLATSSTFWSRTAQAKMYSLHYFLVAVLFLLALGARSAYDSSNMRKYTRWLVALAATLGLSLTNHLMTVLVALPLALMIVVGDRPGERAMSVIRRAALVVPAFLAPLLLYLYMPIRASQSPIMNWGLTNTWGDFWRHVTGAQYRAYIEGDTAANISRNAGLLTGFAAEQWNFLTLVVLAAAIFGAVLLARANVPVFTSTVAFVVISLGFDLVYGISEIEPYAVPTYGMFCVWAGLIPACWLAMQSRATRGRLGTENTASALRQAEAGAIALAVVALASAVLVYPKQDYSKNRLAEQFVLNAFGEMPPKSLVITEYWDYYAPTYYVQLLQKTRPDIVVIDMSLLRYPWYSRQLSQRYPWLIEKSRDIFDRFATEQRKWWNGDTYDPQVINTGYFDLLTSFVERNYPEYTPFVLWLQDCPPDAQCETSQVARNWIRQPVGLTYRLWPAGTAAPQLPVEPSYNLSGVVTDPVPLDTFARANSEMYRFAYLRLADLYSRSEQAEAATRMETSARDIATALAGR